MDADEEKRQAKIKEVREQGHRMLDEPGDWEVEKAPRRKRESDH